TPRVHRQHRVKSAAQGVEGRKTRDRCSPAIPHRSAPAVANVVGFARLLCRAGVAPVDAAAHTADIGAKVETIILYRLVDSKYHTSGGPVKTVNCDVVH